MKQFKIGISFFVLFAVCVISKNVLLLFNYLIALTLHEMAHVFVAGIKGYKLKEMKLSMCGLNVKLDKEIDETDSFLINLAGPSCNLLLSIMCIAIFWLLPNSFKILHMFCFANLLLAVFNLIPVYPLDGGKIFKNFFKNDKKYKNFNFFVKIFVSLLFFTLFVFSLSNKINIFYLIMSLFFITLKDEFKPTFSIFKYSKKREIEKVVIIKISSNKTLFELIKMLKSKYYTLFYCNELNNHYIDEDKLIELATKHVLTTKIKELNL